MSGIPLHWIDAFTSERFAGNPAPVCLLPEVRPDRWLQAVARELNQAETAFLRAEADGFELRWFTPSVEMDLCGHATIASAHFLWHQGHLRPEERARFRTRSGVLTAAREAEWITLDFPSTPPAPCDAPTGLLEALGLERAEILRSKFDYFVVVDEPGKLKTLAPDLRALRSIETRGVIVTAQSDQPNADFLSRFFAPRVGVDEDPVTGSAHCALAPYWAARLGRAALVGRQLSPRGGTVRVQDAGDRVLLGGQAVTVMVGTLL